MTVYKVKRGDTVPSTSNLQSFEIGFNKTANDLYINNNGTIIRLGIKVLTGTSAPASNIGTNNDIYVQYSVSGNDTIIDSFFVKLSGAWVALPAGGASVLMGTTDPTAAIGEDGNLYVKYHTENNVPVVDAFFVKISGAWASVSTSGGAVYLELTQAQYDVLSPAEKNNGIIYFVTDGVPNIPKGMFVGTCATAGTTAAKQVIIDSSQNFKLEVGTTIAVKYSNTSASGVGGITISVNGGIAYPVWYDGAQYTDDSPRICGYPDHYIVYTFDGSYWVWISYDNEIRYTNMTSAQAEAGTGFDAQTIDSSTLKHAVQYHAIPQVDGNERVVGKLGNDTLYEKVFTFTYSDMQGGSQTNSRITGVFVLENISYDKIMLTDAQLINGSPDDTFSVLSMPLPIASTNNVYCRVQIQKSIPADPSTPPSYDGLPFVYFDCTYNASLINPKLNYITWVFTIRYTKLSS